MEDERDAERAIRDFDGANAQGQPIRVTRQAGQQTAKARNPFDHVERPSRSLFERVETRRRSASPGNGYESRPRRGGRGGREGGARGGTPDNIDRYVPGQDRRRSPLRRNRDNPRGGPRGGPGQRRERDRSSRRDPDGHPVVGGRPRKTQEELDAEMEDYWGKTGGGDTQATELNGNGTVPSAVVTGAPVGGNDDIDMIE